MRYFAYTALKQLEMPILTYHFTCSFPIRLCELPRGSTSFPRAGPFRQLAHRLQAYLRYACLSHAVRKHPVPDGGCFLAVWECVYRLGSIPTPNVEHAFV